MSSEINQDIMLAGDDWMRQNNIVTEVTHNNIVLNLLVQYPFIKDVEYYMDTEDKVIQIHIYLGLFDLIFRRTRRLASNVMNGIKGYLYGYTVVVHVRRYKWKR